MTTHKLTVNNQSFHIEVPSTKRLSAVLRDDLGLRATKVGCDAGDCGACTVLLDGQVTCACLMAVGSVSGRSVDTLDGAEGLRPLQDAFARHGAAQCGICTPGMLMTARALLRENPRPTRTEAENALGGVLCRCTGYQKIIDAVCDAWRDDPMIDTPSGAVGASIPRIDGGPKLDGTELFGADIVPRDCLHLRAIRSPHWQALFEFGDIAGWQASQHGVVGVLTAQDVKGSNLFGVIPGMEDQPVLTQHRARFRGEAVALVIGTADGLDAVDLSSFPVTWKPEPEVMNTRDARSAAALHETRPGNLLITGKVRCGDPDTAMASAAQTVEGTMQTGFVEHAYIEPEAGVAWMDGDQLVIRASTQAPVMDRDSTADALGLSRNKVRVIPTAAGGGFGSKLDLSVQPLLGLAALKTGRPCRMVYSRRESMQSTTKRHPGAMTARIGVDARGKLLAMTFDGDFNTGAYASWGPTVANRVPVHASGPYLMPNYHATANAVHTNGPPAGAFRGFGVPQATLLQETLFDKLADGLGMDRLAFRLQNALADGDATTCGQVLGGVGIRECLEALRPHWMRAKDWATAASRMARGIGIASCWYGCGNTALPNPSTIRLGLRPDGALCLHQGATDIGQGANTVIAQICAEVLGIPVRQIELIGPDTHVTPDCGKTSASRQTFVTGNAAKRAAEGLRSDLLRRANKGPDALIRLDGAAVRIADEHGEVVLDLASLDVNALGYALMAEETYDPPTTALDENGQGRPYAVYGYGAQLAMVEVDTDLGIVFVREIVAAHDVGRAINPQLAEGQIEGGIAQGLGLALMEEYIPGRTENLHDYLIPTTSDMPKITSILVEIPDPEGPLGAKGLGEHVLIPTAAAILNAIRHATGAELTQVPALPHRVKAAIDAAKRQP